MSEPVITKRRVTMRNAKTIFDHDGNPVTITHEATDYVRPDYLEAYVAAQEKVWQSVTVSDEPDAGPLGYHGPTHVPAHLDHPLAGQTFPATPGSDAEAAIIAAASAAQEG